MGGVVIGVGAHGEITEGSDWGEFGLCEVEENDVTKKERTYVDDRVWIRLESKREEDEGLKKRD